MLLKNGKKRNRRNGENVIASEIKEKNRNERKNRKRKSLTILTFDAPDGARLHQENYRYNFSNTSTCVTANFLIHNNYSGFYTQNNKVDHREIGEICSNGGISFNNVAFDILLCLQRTIPFLYPIVCNGIFTSKIFL